MKMLDTHLGSGSSRIAAYEMGYDFYAFEIDTTYYERQEKRFKNSIAQTRMFWGIAGNTKQSHYEKVTWIFTSTDLVR